jgi:hypothetical protein
MLTIYTLKGDRQQQALGKIVAIARMAASGRKSISFKAIAVLAMTDDEIVEAFDAAGGPGLPDGFGGNAQQFADYCRAITIDNP